MKHVLTVLALMFSMSPLRADNVPAGSKVIVRPVISATETSTGQPIVLPQKSPQLIASTYEIPPGTTLPKHKHPFPRYGYVLAGTITVTNLDTGKIENFKTGDFILEAVGQWHQGTATGTEPVKLLVIDMVEKGESNTIIFK